MNYIKSLLHPGDVLTAQYNNIKGQLKKIIKTDQEESLFLISDRIYWMPFPKTEKIGRLSTILRQQFRNSYYVWNVSEHSYDTELFMNQVAVHKHTGFPCPPLIEQFMICKNILNWLSKDADNVAIVHCQYTKGRSILILSLLLALIEGSQPDLCFIRVCELLNIEESKFFPSQHLYLTYQGNLLNKLPLNQQPVRLVSILFNKAPVLVKLEGLPSKEFCPYVQIVGVNQQILYNSHNDEDNDLPTYKEENGLVFYTGGIEVSNDIVLRCKHFQSKGLRYPAFRTMLNTSFIFTNVVRFYARDLDVCATLSIASDFFIDLIFEFGDEISSQNVTHNVQKVDEFHEIKLSEKQDSQSSDGNQLLQKLVSQCQSEAESFQQQQEVRKSKPSSRKSSDNQSSRKSSDHTTEEHLSSPLQNVLTTPPMKYSPQQLSPVQQPKLQTQVIDEGDDEFEFNVKMC